MNRMNEKQEKEPPLARAHKSKKNTDINPKEQGKNDGADDRPGCMNSLSR